MTNIGIIIGSDRDTRVSTQVADFIFNRAKELNLEGVNFELVDIKDYNIPNFNEPVAPLMLNKQYTSENVKKWADKIDSLDGFIFITPEYNKGITASLKNAIDNLAPEWNGKAAGIVSYGSTLGVAAALSLRQILTNFNVAHGSASGAFSLFTDFDSDMNFKPAEVHDPTINAMIANTVDWAKALKTLRN
ncbi:NADPH-dependent FMN reductase [Aerococcaceae bacterium WGS1372]